jgi:transcriptional regulator with XRE-family HTH domain
MAFASTVIRHTRPGLPCAPSSEVQMYSAPSPEASTRPRVRLFVIGGTGGLLPLDERLEQSSTSIGSLLIDDRDIEHGHRTSAQQLEFIRSTARLSVTELARVFSVTRQTVHEWCQGATLAPHNARRLDKLADAITLLLNAVGAITVQDLRRSVRAGLSLLDAVRADGNVSAAARELVETLTREAAQRKRLAARFAGRRPPTLEPSEFGSPHLRDDD